MIPRPYIWRDGDTLVGVSALYPQAGYSNIYLFMADVYVVNPTITDYAAITPGTSINLPYKLNA